MFYTSFRHSYSCIYKSWHIKKYLIKQLQKIIKQNILVKFEELTKDLKTQKKKKKEV